MSNTARFILILFYIGGMTLEHRPTHGDDEAITAVHVHR